MFAKNAQTSSQKEKGALIAHVENKDMMRLRIMFWDVELKVKARPTTYKTKLSSQGICYSTKKESAIYRLF